MQQLFVSTIDGVLYDHHKDSYGAGRSFHVGQDDIKMDQEEV
jgi:hypothetical protein